MLDNDIRSGLCLVLTALCNPARSVLIASAFTCFPFQNNLHLRFDFASVALKIVFVLKNPVPVVQ